uniref:Uncharacterized protein n=1 Tax=Anguilla anguilla TaxID=7936 RepID=A0A0E9UND2_ANGAN
MRQCKFTDFLAYRSAVCDAPVFWGSVSAEIYIILIPGSHAEDGQ